jgi:hypothetical protein
VLVTGLLSAAARRSYYSSTIAAFCTADRDAIFAQMARQNDFDLTGTQRHAWLEQAVILQTVLARYTGSIYLEFTIPRASRYKPTPTIIEATLALYRGHSVTEISRADADATNLSITAGTVASIIATTKARSEKAICFVTGVPGAGKTLVGLDAATKHIDHDPWVWPPSIDCPTGSAAVWPEARTILWRISGNFAFRYRDRRYPRRCTGC